MTPIRLILGISLLGLLLLLLNGCGGSSSSSSTPSASTTGTVAFSLDWAPAGTAVHGIEVTLKEANYTQTQDANAGTSSLTFSNVPQGAATYVATAYGTALLLTSGVKATSRAGAPLGLVNGVVTVNGAATSTVGLAADVTGSVSTVEIDSVQTTSLAINSICALYAVARNNYGEAIFIDSSRLSWATSNPAVATLTPASGLSTSATGVGSGNVCISVQETTS